MSVLPKPTVAVVNGAAVAGGAGLVSVCDLAVAVPAAKFGYPEVRRGLVAAMVMPHLLRHVGERAARWLLLTGELIAADEAQRLGLVNEVVAPDLLLPTAETWAGYLAQGGPKVASALAIAPGIPPTFSPRKLIIRIMLGPGITCDTAKKFANSWSLTQPLATAKS